MTMISAAGASWRTRDQSVSDVALASVEPSCTGPRAVAHPLESAAIRHAAIARLNARPPRSGAFVIASHRWQLELWVFDQANHVAERIRHFGDPNAAADV